MNLTLDEIIQLCFDNDMECGQYPESMWEGRAMAKFIVEKLFDENKIRETIYEDLIERINEKWDEV